MSSPLTLADALEAVAATLRVNDRLPADVRLPAITDLTIDVDTPDGVPLVVAETEHAYEWAHHHHARPRVIDPRTGEMEFNALLGGVCWRWLMVPEAPVRYTVVGETTAESTPARPVPVSPVALTQALPTVARSAA